MSELSRAANLLCDLVALPSVNPEGDPDKTGGIYGEARVAELVESYFSKLDVETRRQEVSGNRENVLVFARGSQSDAHPLCLEAHMDTVDVEGMADPFVPRIAGGRIHGRGSCDTKSSLAAMMVALENVVRADSVPPGGVCLAATVDEERGHSGALKLIEEEKLAAAIVGEPTGLCVVPAHKGQAYFEIRAKGRAAHTSAPQHGVNAITMMAEVVRCIERRAQESFARHLHPLCGATQITVSIVQGGTSEHIVPDFCRIALDLRIIPGEEIPEVMAEIRGWLATDLAKEVCERVEVRDPYKTSPSLDTGVDLPLVTDLASAVQESRREVEIVGVPYNTDAGYFSRAGVPSVVFGPGDIAQAHSTTEFLAIEQLDSAVEILTCFLSRWKS